MHYFVDFLSQQTFTRFLKSPSINPNVQNGGRGGRVFLNVKKCNFPLMIMVITIMIQHPRWLMMTSLPVVAAWLSWKNNFLFLFARVQSIINIIIVFIIVFLIIIIIIIIVVIVIIIVIITIVIIITTCIYISLERERLGGKYSCRLGQEHRQILM